MTRRGSRHLLGGLVLTGFFVACSFDWDHYDPRLGAGGAAPGGAGATGGGGAGGNGGGGAGATAGGGASATGGGGAGAMGGGGAGATGGGSCGTVDVLGDDFGDGELAVNWRSRTFGSASVEEVGGQIVVTTPTDGSAGQGDVLSERYYDLRGKRLRLEVPTMVDTSSDVAVWFGVERDGGAWDADIEQRHGMLGFEVGVDGIHSTLAFIPYDPVAHRWLAYREQDGVFYLETSPDGANWTVRGQRAVAQLFPLESLRITFGADDPGSTPAAGQAAFDNLQAGQSPAEGYCPANSYSDDFDDGTLAYEWAVRNWDNAECSFTEEGGQLRFALSGAAAYNCGITLPSAYDLTGTSVSIEVPAITTPEHELTAWLSLAYDSASAISIAREDGQITFQYEVDGSWFTGASASYDLTAHRFWRLREQAGTVYWETSPDGVSWTVGLELPSPIDVSAVELQLGAECWSGCSAPALVWFDNYNRLP